MESKNEKNATMESSHQIEVRTLHQHPNKNGNEASQIYYMVFYHFVLDILAEYFITLGFHNSQVLSIHALTPT